MKYHILLGILLWTIGAALAQPSAPPTDTSRTTDGGKSAPSLKKPPSSHGKSGKPATPSGKPATPLAKPESGEEDDVQDDSDEDEPSADCDGCLLALLSQTPAAYAVAGPGATTASSSLRLTRSSEAAE
jgi:hypothetical protein